MTNTRYKMLRLFLIKYPKRHQIHHRGQMTILIRQAGLTAPGIYGPNEEETAAMRAAHATNK
ncbi:DinB family protein [Paenibacillus sp. sptzw28]|uniref:DinB family protein n=1 Tax=Paenibacillus sp. sptzw28 TaxID=715179 RepID=UPI00216350D3|nr:DinB family protein [Paenibacillus sp. sptzw28]